MRFSNIVRGLNAVARKTFFSCGAILCVACSTPQHGPDPAAAEPRLEIQWETKVYRDHPLVGRIWSQENGAFVSRADLATAIQQAQVVLLGERHDHPDHHRLQALLIQEVKSEALVGFEMLDEDDAPKIDGITEPHAFEEASQWNASGWPEFALYRPIFEVIHRRNFKIRAVHPRRSRMMSMAKEPAAYPKGNDARSEPISVQGQMNLREDLDRGHCGQASPRMIEMMVNAQIFKDRWMSHRIEIDPMEKAIVIAGNGHVRKDYGMPNHLNAGVLSLGLIEVEADRVVVSDYSPARFDYLLFTPRLDTLDPCEKYKRSLEQMKARN